MPLNSIVVIILRITALSWLMHSLAWAGAMVVNLSAQSAGTVAGTMAISLSLAAALWFSAGKVAALVTRNVDSSISLGPLSRRDLYCFALVFLGLSSILSSVADTIIQAHQLLTAATLPGTNRPQSADALYHLSRPLITLVAGGFCLAFASRIAGKLIDRENRP